MILFVANEYSHYQPYFQSWGRNVGAELRHMTYGDLLGSVSLPVATYIFTDIERLDASEAEKAAEVWAKLSADPRCRVLNHPIRTLGRYELLRTLFEQGHNQFNVYKLTERRRPNRFPVFLRIQNDHQGPLTSLIHTQQELDQTLEKLTQQSIYRDNLMITEFFDAADEAGMIRKYGAFLIGDQVIPEHALFGRSWMLKTETALNHDPQQMAAFLDEERDYLESNPHEEPLRKMAQAAGIEYGRVDYSVHAGRVQVWEVNTNPTLPSPLHGRWQQYIIPERVPLKEAASRKINAAFAKLDTPSKRQSVRVKSGQRAVHRLAYSLLGTTPCSFQARAVQAIPCLSWPIGAVSRQLASVLRFPRS